MRNFLLTLAAVAIAMPAVAATNVAGKSNAAVTPGIPSQSSKKIGALKNTSVIERVKAAKASALTRAADSDFEIITEAPEGKLETMLGSSNTFYPYYDEVSMDETYGIAYEGVWTDNGEVYLKNPISMLDWDTYIKGTVTEEGLLFEFPQPLYRMEDEEGVIDLYVDVLEYAELEYPDDPEEYYVTFIPSEETRSILFTKMDDGSYSMEDEYMMGVTYNGAWQGYGEMYLSLLPFEATPATIPDGIKYNYSYVLADEFTGWDHTVMRQIGIGELDGTTYITGLASGMPDAVIYGTFDKENNTLTIPSNQFLGKYYNHYIFMMAGIGKSWYDEIWQSEMYSFDIVDDPLVLTYDPDVNEFHPVLKEGFDYSFVIFNFGNVETYPCEYYAIDRIYSQGEITNFAPIAPEILAIYDIGEFDPEYSYALEFNIFGDNEEGQILADNNIYYNIFINGELYTFTSEEYPSLLEAGVKEVTDIPVFFEAGDDIFSSGNYHGVAFKHKDIETVGVRAVYIDGDTRAESEIVTVTNTGEPVSVAITNASSASKTEFFDINGRRISNSASNAIIIKRTIMSDGSVKVDKLIRH